MNSRLSKMLKYFFSAFRLKPFFMTKRMILTPRTKIFSSASDSKIEVDSPRGPVSLRKQPSFFAPGRVAFHATRPRAKKDGCFRRLRPSLPLDFFANKCRHDINKLNFNRNTKFSNLSSEERVALKNLSERKDIIVKAADKGGALVVWRADLYQKEALRQLSDTSFYAKVDKDLTSTNQQIVKSTINDLIVKQELPATATISSSQLLELHVFTFYLKFTNLTTQADLLSLRVVALPNSFLEGLNGVNR